MIPVSKPDLLGKEKEYAYSAIDSGWISSKGEYIEKFEEAFARYNGMNYGVSCNSGTNALYLALKALRIGEGDEVIVPEFTMVATAWAVSYCGAKPVFVDCKDDLTINPELIEEKITSRTKAIMPVHIYGRKCDMERIKTIAYEYNLKIVEDIAEGHGIKPEGDVGCFSFYGNKIVTTGEGGMCVTNDPKLAEQMVHLRSMAFDKHHTFYHKKLGFNFRMTNIQAAIGLAQIERMDDILAKRKQIESWYDEFLNLGVKMPKRDVVWMYDIKVTDQAYMQRILEKNGIESRLFFKPMSMMPMYRNGSYTHLNAYRWSLKGIYLPTYNELTQEEIKKISNIVNEAEKMPLDYPYAQTK